MHPYKMLFTMIRTNIISKTNIQCVYLAHTFKNIHISKARATRSYIQFVFYLLELYPFISVRSLQSIYSFNIQCHFFYKPPMHQWLSQFDSFPHQGMHRSFASIKDYLLCAHVLEGLCFIFLHFFTFSESCPFLFSFRLIALISISFCLFCSNGAFFKQVCLLFFFI